MNIVYYVGKVDNVRKVDSVQIVQEAQALFPLVPDKEVFSTGELAAICGVTKHTIIAAVEKGGLRASQTPGGHNRIRREDALDFMQRHNFIPQKKKNTIVVIDGDEFIRDIIEQMFGEAGCSILHATAAYQAAVLIEREKPDLIILDLHSAGIDCKTISGHIRDNKFGKPARMLAVLDRKKNSPVQMRDSKLADEVITKPFRIEELQDLVEEMINT